MQKILRRTTLAEAQVARRLGKKKDAHLRAKMKSQREQDLYKAQLVRADINRERQTRREDYELGPLAPRRDVGTMRDVYGTVSSNRMKGKFLRPEEKERLYPDTPRYVNIVPDDRVVLLEGRDKGKIGKVLSVDSNTFEVTVENLNLIEVAIPEYMQKAERNTRPTRSIPQAIPIYSVRLVFPYKDPQTGEVRDVIASKLLNGPIWHDRHTGRKRWTRYVPGLENGRVPWPQRKPKKREDHKDDTLRSLVEARTFIPTLLTPPMPFSVIDELRNKFSKFRTRHDEEYIQEKIQEEVLEKARQESTQMMLDPMRTIKALARQALKEERKAKGLRVQKRPKVTTEMLGQAMARIQGLSEIPKEEIIPL